MPGLMFVIAALALTLAAGLAARRRGLPVPLTVPLPPLVRRSLGADPVLAVFRPDPELALTLAALACAGLGALQVLAVLALGRQAVSPVDLALGAVVLPALAGRARGARGPWILTEGRLIPGGGAPVPLDRVARVRVRLLSLEVVVRGPPGAGPERLRLTALTDPRGAARTIRSAIRATARRPAPAARDGPRSAA